MKDGNGELETDAGLAVAAAGGCRTAFASLVDRYYEPLFGMA